MSDPSLEQQRTVVAGSAEIQRRLRMMPIGHAMAITLGGAVGLLTVVTVGGFALLGWPGIKHPARLEISDLFDLLKLVFAVLGGVGAVVALVMAYRRQRVAEAANELAEEANRLAQAVQAHREKVDETARAHQELVATDARHDAAERRITELYTKAADQLGSAKAPVRLAGLYALERLAQGNPAHRQTVVDVICAYLRMPFTPPRPKAPEKPPIEASDEAVGAVATGPAGQPAPSNSSANPAAPTSALSVSDPGTASAAADAREELQVRLTAQRILSAHLCRPDGTTPHEAAALPHDHLYWPGMRVDLTNAALIDVDYSRLTVTTARFEGASFSGDTGFREASFSGIAGFDGASFSGIANFGKASFSGGAGFDGATFSRLTGFDGASFSGAAGFTGASFSEVAWFGRASFSAGAYFEGASFSGDAGFEGASFFDLAWFGKASFSGLARFRRASFSGQAWFERASFSGEAWFDGASFSGDAGFAGASFSGDARLDGATAARQLDDARKQRVWPSGWTEEEPGPADPSVGRLVRVPTRPEEATPDAGTTSPRPSG